jgi:hypothetical protein
MAEAGLIEICEGDADVGVGRGENAERQGIVNAFLHLRHSVAGGENFDAEEWRSPNDGTGAALSNKHRDVRDPVSPGFDLNALFGHGEDTPLLFAIPQVPSQRNRSAHSYCGSQAPGIYGT